MRSSFPLFDSHLDLSHFYWQRLVKKGDIVIDATCGNGKDTLKLCELALSPDTGIVYGFDVQIEAIAFTNEYLKEHLDAELLTRLKLLQCSHAYFPEEIQTNSVSLIVYNLGYLPGGDKAKTTHTSSTLQSIENALMLLKMGGAISITCYPGHAEGNIEMDALIQYASQLPPKEWSCCHHSWLNRRAAPSLLLMQKTL